MTIDKNDREFRIMIINALILLIFEEDMSESEFYTRRENLKKQIENLHMKEELK